MESSFHIRQARSDGKAYCSKMNGLNGEGN